MVGFVFDGGFCLQWVSAGGLGFAVVVVSELVDCGFGSAVGFDFDGGCGLRWFWL